MDVFSLEEEEYDRVFLTQESRGTISNNGVQESCEKEEFLGLDPTDFQSPCASVTKLYMPVYSDVSDEEFEEKKDNGR